jgi:hypothetical protein
MSKVVQRVLVERQCCERATVVLSTHNGASTGSASWTLTRGERFKQVSHLEHADQIIVLSANGTIESQGSSKVLLHDIHELQTMIDAESPQGPQVIDLDAAGKELSSEIRTTMPSRHPGRDYMFYVRSFGLQRFAAALLLALLYSFCLNFPSKSRM